MARIRSCSAAPKSCESASPPGPSGPTTAAPFGAYVDKKKGEGWFIKTATGWDEEDDGPRIISPKSAGTRRRCNCWTPGQLGVRLFHERLSFKLPQNKKWLNIYHGSWEATGTVVAPK